MAGQKVDFGFQKVAANEKDNLVKEVFDSVAPAYDHMNDLMSFGLHRFWKRYLITKGCCNKGDKVLDLAAGTGDLSKLWLDAVGDSGTVFMTDINLAMLNTGISKMIDLGYWSRFTPVLTNAESLPFSRNYFDCVSMSFGLRNVTNKTLVLEQVLQVLKPGGRFVVLEFSQPDDDMISKFYDYYSFNIIPKLGKIIVNDQNSYQYLVESIRKHPSRQQLKDQFLNAGFDDCFVESLCFGIVAIHVGVKY